MKIMPESNGEQAARRMQRKKKTTRTSKCPKTKEKTDASKRNARRAKGLNRATKANHKSLLREATGSQRNRMIDHPHSTA